LVRRLSPADAAGGGRGGGPLRPGAIVASNYTGICTLARTRDSDKAITRFAEAVGSP
jgi:hypothetical protein